MKKRLLSLFCVFSVILSCVVIPVAAQESGTYYQAGYMKTDISPLDGENLIPVPMAGYGNPESRWATEITDHLYATCTAVVDVRGTAMFYISLDAIRTEANMTAMIREGIRTALADKGVTVADNQIMVSSSHTHSGPDFNNIYTNRESEKDARYAAAWAYYQSVADKIVVAAISAYDDREAVTMSKGEADASELTGYALNSARHYEMTSTSLRGYGSDTKTYIAGDNFGGSGHNKGYTYDDGPLKNYKIKSVQSVTQANDNLYLLKFTPVNGSKDPIVLANWRAHPAINGGSNKTNISADYVGYFRNYMEAAGYRVSFIQGASGNINARSYDDNVYMVNGVDWRTEAKNTAQYCDVYGKNLAKVAEAAANSAVNCELGAIRVETMRYRTQAQKDTAGLKAAATAALATANASYPYSYTYEGTVYIVNSQYHAKSILSRAENYSAGMTSRHECNVIAMGEDVMILTAPHELYDYYDANGSTNPADNDWLELVDTATYGTPFVMGYTNASAGYLPNTLAYEYNENSGLFGAGSYEANTTAYAKGEGEKLLNNYQQILKAMTAEEEICPMCKQKTRWTTLFEGSISGQNWQTGHYRLAEDVSVAYSAQKILADGATVCIDLNGNNITTAGRNFNVQTGAVLNLMGQGTILSYTGNNNVSGGACTVSGTMNIYDGVTVKFEKNHTYRTNEKIETEDGGALYISGTVNMYGGQIIGGELADASYNTDPNCNGGAVYVTNTGTLKLYGGSISGGSGATAGNCVYLGQNSSLLLSGDAKVEEVYLNGYKGTTLTVKDTFTGSVALRFASTVAEGTDIGTSENAQLIGTLTYTDGTNNGNIAISGNDLVLTTYAAGTVASIGKVGYPTLQQALDEKSTEQVKLLADVTENVTVSHNDILDLNGKSINGTVTINSGVTLSVADSETADFTVADGVYGKIKAVAGAGELVGVDTLFGRYVQTQEATGVSFHLVEARLTGITLRAASAGMYYTGEFQADEKVAVTSYGVALSTVAMPTAENLESCKYSQMKNWTAGATNDGNGTLLYNIMNKDLGYTENKDRSEMTVYGCGYIQVGDEWIFGNGSQYSLRTLTEAVDARYAKLNDVQKENLKALYEQFRQVTDFWNLPMMTAALQEAYETRPLKILTIGNSYSLDSTNLLYEVAKAEGTEEIVLGTLYHSSCSLAMHVDYLLNDAKEYIYYKNNSGTWVTKKATMKDGIINEDWDLVVLQQAPIGSGRPETYNDDIQTIMDYVLEHDVDKTTKPQFVWHMTWSYPVEDAPGSDVDTSAQGYISAFKTYYNNDQMTMYKAITSAVRQKIATRDDFSIVIPTGTAMQNARSSYLHDYDLYRDYTHLNDYGRVFAAYTWYVALTGKNIQKLAIDTVPGALRCFEEDWTEDLVLTEEEQAIIVESVKNAIACPYKVTQSVYTTVS